MTEMHTWYHQIYIILSYETRKKEEPMTAEVILFLSFCATISEN